ncbi:MAG: NAD(P)H-hydrate dehydratase [Mycobacteriales bacterium]
MLHVWSVADVRAAEAELMARLPEGALMRRAAAGLATQLIGLLRGRGGTYGSRVTLLIGAGDNGGDALLAGAALADRGVRVTAHLLVPEHAHQAGLATLLAAGGVLRPATADAIEPAAIAVDGIVGIGGSGGLRPAAVPLVTAAAERSVLVVAVDLPSGVAPDTGAVEGEAVRADVTVTFGALKPGLVLGDGATYAGQLRLIGIGLRPTVAPALQVLTNADVAAILPMPDADSDKYRRGVLGIVAGSTQYGGAAVLAVGSALRTGIGMVRYAGRAGDAVRARWPEVVVTDGRPGDAGRVQAWVVGPGIGTDSAARGELAEVLASDVPVLVDADGLTLLAREPALARDRAAATVLTPHDREFERFGTAIGSDRLGAARRLARDLGVTVLLKGNATIVAPPAGPAYANPTGSPWLATAGSGDVLSGCAGALLTGGVAPDVAAAAAAYPHGLAGQIAGLAASVTALDVLETIPAALLRVRGTPPSPGDRIVPIA